jgi:hypothetical protein
LPSQQLLELEVDDDLASIETAADLHERLRALIDG